MHLQFAFEERNEDASKAINASSFDHKMQAFTVYFLRKEMGMRAKQSMLLRSILRCRHCGVCFFREEMRMRAKHSMLLPNI